MAVTTKNNPGSFSTAYTFGFSACLKRLLKLAYNKNWRRLTKGIVAELLNVGRFGFFFGLVQKKECNICEYKGPFVHLYNELRIAWNSACPTCDSRSRHRGLFFLYNEYIITDEVSRKILHFAPEPVFYRLFLDKSFLDYKTTDFFLEDVDFVKEDIQKLSFADDSFDVVLCNHVIEHVPDDVRAFREINRILTKGGMALLTIPGNFTRPKTVYFDHLNYNGHYRDYGIDVVDKLKLCFGEIDIVNLSKFSMAGHDYAIRKNDLAFVCKKKTVFIPDEGV